MAIQRRALVLNQNYEPLNVCSVRRAFVLVYRGKAEVLEQGDEPIAGADEQTWATPSVIRLSHFVRRPHPLDHVVPKHRGGAHAWENLVTACRACNHRKGGRTPQEARMDLLSEPRRPSTHPAVMYASYLARYREWRPFLSGWSRDDELGELGLAAGG